MEKALKKDGILETSLITVEVDSIIESNPGYIRQRERLIKNKDEEGKSALYWKYRGEADVISDQILNNALLEGFDVAWETTGRTIAWTIREIKRIQKKGYHVTLVYPLVPVDALVRRAKKRESETGQTPAPKEQIEKGATDAITNLQKVLNVVDDIYIYDNSGEKGSEQIIIEINNVWDWTPEDSDFGPGLKRNVVCDCHTLKNELSKLYTDEIMTALKSMCTTCKIKR